MSRELSNSLLHAQPTPSERRPHSRWAYPLGGVLLVSVFVLYHTAVLLVWNTPGESLAKPFHSSFLKQTKGYEYFRGMRLTQSWSMFAPNPNRTNVFVHVYVRDQHGQDWDFQQDIWAKDRYPYFWYDRRGKVNRNIDGKKHHQRVYGAWVCREWERQHGGEPAKSVTFVRRVTKVPPAREVIEKRGWDQWAAPFKQTEQETITCKTIAHGTLPNYLRERYGLPLIDEDEQFIPVKIQTWWTKQEAERLRAEREAEREAKRQTKHQPKQTKTSQPKPEPDVDQAVDLEDSPDQ